MISDGSDGTGTTEGPPPFISRGFLCAHCGEPIPSSEDSDMFCSEACGDAFDADLRDSVDL